MGRAEYFSSFRQNADEFICSILPGISHPQVQYSPGIFFFFVDFYLVTKCLLCHLILVLYWIEKVG